jgi:hypothetical protein
MNVSKKLHLILDTRSLIIKNLGYLPAAFWFNYISAETGQRVF